jgi:4'-phosphopantetheinyl transferase
MPSITALVEPAPGIRLWWCSLVGTASSLRSREGFLSPPERARASRFGHPQLRDRYVMGRGALRTILGEELGVHPAAIDIVRGTRGRPQLAGEPRLDFNISHTGDVAIVGILQCARIGVDVECIDRAINVAGIARKFLTHHERDELAACDSDTARRRVLTLWTCKEAMSKATGEALSAPFGSIDINLLGRRALRHGPGVYQRKDWMLYEAAVPSGYVASVAAWNPR